MSLRSDASRARSLPHRGAYYAAVFLTLFHYLCLVATLTLAVLFALDPGLQTLQPVLGGLVAAVISWFISFFKRRTARCPLCKGTPLLDSAASKHSKARRLGPFNYGTTATLTILGCQRFRCMYCGTPYDLLKQTGGRNAQDPEG